MTRDALFVRVMHCFSERFEEHAIVKGGLALRMLGSPRATTDIDYVFVPHASKKEVAGPVQEALQTIDPNVEVTTHSKMIRAVLRGEDGVGIQVKISVAAECSSKAMSTATLAVDLGPPQVVRVQDMSVAFAHKLGAWNERRLLRDLYDVSFLRERVGVRPDLEVLGQRLDKVQSKLPKLKKLRSMRMGQFADALRLAASEINETRVANELGPLLPASHLAGIESWLQVQVRRVADELAVDAAS